MEVLQFVYLPVEKIFSSFFQFGPIINTAVRNIHAQVLCGYTFLFLWDNYLGLEWLNHTVGMFLKFPTVAPFQDKPRFLVLAYFQN